MISGGDSTGLSDVEDDSTVETSFFTQVVRLAKKVTCNFDIDFEILIHQSISFFFQVILETKKLKEVEVSGVPDENLILQNAKTTALSTIGNLTSIYLYRININIDHC